MAGRVPLRAARSWALALGVVAASAGGTHLALERAGGPAGGDALAPFSTEPEGPSVVDVGEFKLSGDIAAVEATLPRGASIPAPFSMEAPGDGTAHLRVSGALVDGTEREVAWAGRGVLSVGRGVGLVLEGSSTLSTVDGDLRVALDLSALRISTGGTRLAGDVTVAGLPTKSVPRPVAEPASAVEMTVGKATEASGSGSAVVVLDGPSLLTLDAPVALSGDLVVTGGGHRSPQRTRQVEVLSGAVSLAIGQDGSLSLAEAFTGRLEIGGG